MQSRKLSDDLADIARASQQTRDCGPAACHDRAVRSGSHPRRGRNPPLRGTGDPLPAESTGRRAGHGRRAACAICADAPRAVIRTLARDVYPGGRTGHPPLAGAGFVRPAQRHRSDRCRTSTADRPPLRPQRRRQARAAADRRRRSDRLPRQRAVHARRAARGKPHRNPNRSTGRTLRRRSAGAAVSTSGSFSISTGRRGCG